MQILAISGSLRAASSNTTLLRAAAVLALPPMGITLFEEISSLPAFNPDLDGETPPPSVSAWRRRVLAADGLLFSVPEYAHGVPGALKNALDWLVGSGELTGKPVTLFHASTRAMHARASLTETLTVMSAEIVRDAVITVELMGKMLTADTIVADPGMSETLRRAIDVFALAIDGMKLRRICCGFVNQSAPGTV